MTEEYQMTDTNLGTVDVKSLQPLDRETEGIMKSELRTGLGLSLFYYLFIISIPILNWYLTDLAYTRIWGGMTLTWFLTTIVGMVMAFLIAYIHTKSYEKRLAKYDSSSPGKKSDMKGGHSA